MKNPLQKSGFFCYTLKVMITAFLIFMLAFSCLVLFVILSAFLGFLQTRVPFVPTSTSDIDFIARELKIGPNDIFYDLGSGNGKVCFLINRLSGAKCLGFELTWWTHLLAQLNRKLFYSKKKIEFKNENFFKVNWAEANYVYGYLYPPLMARVKEKFFAECKPGSVAIIRDFPFLGVKPDIIYKRPGSHEIYIYKK